MPHRSTNNPSDSIQEMSWSEVDAAVAQIPESMRQWLYYEASTPINPVQVIDEHRKGKEWSEIWEFLLRFSRDDHCDAFQDYTLHRNAAKERAEIRRMAQTEKRRFTADDWFSSNI